MDKPDKEKQARERIKKEFVDASELTEYMESYESKIDEEAKFVYAVDKVIAIINVYLFKNDNYFHSRKLSVDQVLAERIPRMADSKEITDLFKNQIIPFLAEKGIFHKTDGR